METLTSAALNNPPVVEVVIGIQFQPIAGFTSAHYGWFWKESLESSWFKAVDAQRILDQNEKFGNEQEWVVPSLQLLAADNSDRIQFINSTDDRVIQIQDNRFIYNWRKRGSGYPRFKELYPDFAEKLSKFREFIGRAGLPPIVPNQWEITYVNQIPKGELWETPQDWHKLLPTLYSRPLESSTLIFESVTMEWHFEITPRRGRVHIHANHGKISQGGAKEALLLNLTARGAVGSADPFVGVESGIRLGHAILVETFTKLASEDALNYWGASQ